MKKKNKIPFMSKKDITIYPLSDFEGLRRAGRLAAETLDYITEFVVPGVSTGHLDDLLERFMRDHGGIPANIGYCGFPKASCISPNHVICHGIPSEHNILESDGMEIPRACIMWENHPLKPKDWWKQPMKP